MTPVLANLNAAAVRYLVIGGQAMRLHGLPRFTMDWDLFIPARDADNLRRLNDALVEWLDGPVLPMKENGENFIQTYQTPWGVLQFHLVMPGVSSFDEAYGRASSLSEDGLDFPTLCEDDLLKAKLATHRPQDQQDIDYLQLRLHPSSVTHAPSEPGTSVTGQSKVEKGKAENRS